MIYGKNSKFKSICQNEGKPHLLRQLTIYLYNIEKFVKFLLVKPIMHGNFNLCPLFFQVMLLLGAQNTTDPCKMVISMMLLQSKSVMHEINSGTCDNNLYSKNTEKPLKI